jgi:hypothetical protein
MTTETAPTLIGIDAAALTPAQATERLAELQKNPEWRAKVTSAVDGADEKRELAQLLQTKTGDGGQGDQIDRIISGTAELPLVDTHTGKHLTVRNQMSVVDDLKAIGVSDGSIRSLLEGEAVDEPTWRAVEELRSQFLGDPEFVKRYLAGGREERKKMALIGIIRVGGKKAA